MLRYDKPIYGYIWYKENESKKFHKVTIFSANALCAMIEITLIPKEQRSDPKAKYLHNLFGFFADEQHIKNVMKSSGEALPLLFSKVTRVKINMAYKEARILLKYFVQSGYKCNVYYDED